MHDIKNERRVPSSLWLSFLQQPSRATSAIPSDYTDLSQVVITQAFPDAFPTRFSGTNLPPMWMQQSLQLHDDVDDDDDDVQRFHSRKCDAVPFHTKRGLKKQKRPGNHTCLRSASMSAIGAAERSRKRAHDSTNSRPPPRSSATDTHSSPHLWCF